MQSGLGWKRNGMLLAVLLLGSSLGVRAQFSEAPQVPASELNAPALKPPVGVKVAIVEFDDMQCPLCAAWNPTLMAAAAKYHVAWVRHDFLIRGHNWSRQAAVDARWFDAKSEKLGSDYRNAIFAQQRDLATEGDLADCTTRFAKEHGLALPFVLDPQGKLMDTVDADCRLGLALGVHQTPTVFVVTAGSREPGHSFVQVSDINMLYAYLDQAVGATETGRVGARAR